MANEMRTFVTVKSDVKEVATRLKEIFKFDESSNKYEANAIDVINNLEGTDYSYKNESTKEDWDREVDFPPDDLYDSIIGVKWMNVEYDHYEGSPEDCNIVLTTAWYVPTTFLSRLRDELQVIDEDCYIKGTYEDETYDPSGAFIYGKFDYDDTEDIDEVFDWDEYEEDDFYTENWHESLSELERDVETAYVEYLEDRIQNPENYEGF